MKCDQCPATTGLTVTERGVFCPEHLDAQAIVEIREEPRSFLQEAFTEQVIRLLGVDVLTIEEARNFLKRKGIL